MPFTISCNDIATGGGSSNFSWSQLVKSQGDGHDGYGIIRSGLTTSLENTRYAIGGWPITVISGYRRPYGNANTGGYAGSRHMWGDGVDIVGCRLK